MRGLRGILLVGLLCFVAVAPVLAAPSPTSGTLTPTSGPLTFTGGPFPAPNAAEQVQWPPCNPLGTGPGPEWPCDSYQLTVAIPAGDTNDYSVVVKINWTNPAAEFDVVTCSGFLTASAVCGDATNPPLGWGITAAIPQVSAFRAKAGTNPYTLQIVPYVSGADIYTTTVSLVRPPDPRPQASGIAPRYRSYPGTSGGSGEPSLGANWRSGNTMYLAGTSTFRVSWDDCSSPASATWVEKSAPNAVTSLDPILFHDRYTSRTFTDQLYSACSLLSFTDDDGESYTPSEGCGLPTHGVDHQTLGGGPFAIAPSPPGIYPDAVYYCSQDAATIFCAMSPDGGLSFGPGVAVWTQNQCFGIHGHIKVAPDGTAYLPDMGCNGMHGVAVSETNGAVWTIHQIKGTGADGQPFQSLPSQGIVDPSVGIATDGTVYYGYQNGEGAPHVAVSHDKGATWVNDQDVGAAVGVKASTFPEVVAGDPTRAAFMFLGSSNVSSWYQDDLNFKGPWYVYIATTYDGGLTWKTVNATPGDPVQRASICNLGTIYCIHSPNDRNLLDFNDVTIDRTGRVQGAFADGCTTSSCINGTTNDYSDRATIVRQSGGRTLFAAYDPVEPAIPAPPKLSTATKAGSTITVKWLAPDDGGSALTGFKIYRGDTSGSETFLAQVGPTPTQYADTTATASNYFYQVTALNAMGESGRCREVSVTGISGGSTDPVCSAAGFELLTDPTGDNTNGAPLPSHDIVAVDVSEEFTSLSTRSITFKVKVAGLNVAPAGSPSPALPPNAAWNVQWTQKDSNGISRDMWVQANTIVNPAVLTGNYGFLDPASSPTNPLPIGANQRQCNVLQPSALACPQVRVAADFANNEIVIEFFITGRMSYSTSTTLAHVFDADILPGTEFATLTITTLQLVGVGGRGITEQIDIAGPSVYTMHGNLFCGPPAVTLLTATPAAVGVGGTVHFDGSGSHAAMAGDTVKTYTFDFGDGNDPVTQTTALIDHVYAAAGDYTATLSVTTTGGAVSSPPAQQAIGVSAGMSYYTVTPCRVYDSRTSDGALANGVARAITMTGGTCAIPATAKAVSLNVTAIAPTALGSLALYPEAGAPPVEGTVDFKGGAAVARANNAVLGLAAAGATLQARPNIPGGGSVQVVVDVNGYFQ